MNDIGDCSVYFEPSVLTFATSVVISVGIVLSYLPQYFKIMETRSSLGLSPTFLLLSSTAGIASLANLVLLSFISIPCCKQLTAFECTNSQISLIQVGLQAVSTTLILVLCVIFTYLPGDAELYNEIFKVWTIVWKVMGVVIISLLLAFWKFSDRSIVLYAKVLGLFSTFLAVIQYLPQIFLTFSLKRSGTLSVPMMCIQTPGGFIWTATLYMKPGSNWSSWLPYLTAAVIQGLLLTMCLYYDFTAPKNSLVLPEEDYTD